MRVKKDILHVVVGAGFPLAFSNAVRSVLRHTPDDVLAIYNVIDAEDARGLEALELHHFGERLTVLARENSPDHQKIGGLFSAYNYALERAINRYTYISLIQGDMQMVKTTSNRIELLDSIFSSNTPKVFFVTTVADEGSLHDGIFDEFWSGSNTPSFSFARGATAVGVLKTSLVASEGFRFQHDEAATGEKMRKREYVTASVGTLADLAFNPWPGTVRKGIRDGSDVPIGLADAVLKLIQKAPSEESLPIGNRQVRNIVVPDGFRTLYPYWASDLQKTKWIPRRREATKQLGIGFFSGIDEKGKISSYLLPSKFRRSPGLGYVLRRLLAGCFQLILHEVKIAFYYFAREKNWLRSSQRDDNDPPT